MRPTKRRGVEVGAKEEGEGPFGASEGGETVGVEGGMRKSRESKDGEVEQYEDGDEGSFILPSPGNSFP